MMFFPNILGNKPSHVEHARAASRNNDRFVVVSASSFHAQTAFPGDRYPILARVPMGNNDVIEEFW